MTSETDCEESMQKNLPILILPTALAVPAQTTVPVQPVTAAIITHSSAPRSAAFAAAEATNQI
jgi:hypothetical protein